MKYLKNSIIALVIGLALLTSCRENKHKQLAKTWQVSDIDTPSELPDSVKSAMLLNSTLQFSEDGHYTSSGGIGADQGTYTLDEEGDMLSTISSAGRNSDVYTIKDLDNDKLILKRGETTITCQVVKP